MNKKTTRLAAALFAGFAPVWATASTLPAYETNSAAGNVLTSFYSFGPVDVASLDFMSTSGATAQISGADYTASASTTLGSNHAYASVSSTPSNLLSAGSSSDWYEQVTITGGTETGIAHFTVHLTGTVDVGAFGGSAGYTLGTSTAHPSELVSSLQYFNSLHATQPWVMDAVNPIASYLLGASPYNDTSVLFPTTPTDPLSGIPSIDPSMSLGSNTGMGFPTPDLILTPGAGRNVDITLHGTLTFTYGEAFYLIGGLGVSVFGDGLTSFCAFDIGGTCTPPPKEGAGATTLDFTNSANLVSIALPEGATASFASGATYNVTTVPEPAEWLMLLAGLTLVGWRARRRSA